MGSARSPEKSTRGKGIKEDGKNEGEWWPMLGPPRFMTDHHHCM